jgi:sulfur-oxidizing protein SoxY
MDRRVFLKGTLASAVTAVTSTSLLLSNAAFAAWPKAAMEAEKMSDAVTQIAGSDGEVSDKVKIKAPEIAENGAVVPVTVDAGGIVGVTKISIFAEKNNRPLVASFEIPEGSLAYVSTRIKMGKTSNVVALVHTKDKVYRGSKEVKVTIGGCGG